MNPIQPFSINTWEPLSNTTEQIQITELLEAENVLFFPQLEFKLTDEEQKFLSPQYVDPKTKNISFDIRNNTLRGTRATATEQQQLQALLRRFAQHAKHLVDQMLPHYSAALEQVRTSLRPVEVSQRKLSPRKDDRRLHVDAFPANPNQGCRILRVFSNVNPRGEARVWRLGEPFAEVAQRFLPQIKKAWPGSAQLLRLFKITKSLRTPYDHIMLQMHDQMKADEHYQKHAKQIEFHFPAQSTWIVQTDHVSHAAMFGQHLLEQTFYLPVHAMLNAERSPLKILEKLTGRSLV